MFGIFSLSLEDSVKGKGSSADRIRQAPVAEMILSLFYSAAAVGLAGVAAQSELLVKTGAGLGTLLIFSFFL
jgi:hypothetical protein